MAGLQQTVEYLSKSIGPRPAGTEEEQKAAVFISEQLQQVAGLPTATEEFNCNADSDIPAAVCSAVAVVAAIVGMLVDFMAIPCLVLALLAAVLFAAEILDKPIISRVLSRGISQNVVATYKPAVPASGRQGRQRKVVLVAHYDTGKVNPLLRKPILTAMPILQWVGVAGIAATALLMVLRVAGVGGTVSRALCIVAAVCAALPLLATIVNRISPYTEGANCNAAGVAVMLEVADRVAHGSAAPADGGYTVHGAQAAEASGFVPEGAELVYDALSTEGDSEQSARARLLSAKAAVAAMSGKPVSDTVHIDLADNLVKVQEPPIAAPTDEAMQETRSKTREAFAPVSEEELAAMEEPEEAAAQPSDVVELQAVPVEEPQDDVPDWFKSAQKKAKKPVTEAAPVYRSRYAQAMEAAQRAREEEERAAAEEAARIEEERKAAEAQRQAEEAAARAAELQAQMASVPILAQEASSADGALEEEIPLEGATRRFVPVEVTREEVARVEVSAAAPLVPAIAAAPAAPAAPEVPAASTPAPRTRRESFLDSLPSLSMPMKPVTADSVPTTESASAPHRRSADVPVVEERSSEGAVQNQNFQPAPLAEPRTSSHERANRLRMTVPSLSGSITARPSTSPQATAPAPRVVVPALGADPIPEPVEEPKTVATAGAFGSATGVFDPVGDELIEDVEDHEIYVEDVDDSDYQSQITETGAFAGPGYVSMPKSRLGRLFGKHRSKNKKAEESTPQEWLSVDEGFDARSVGAARGGWESFRSEEEDPYEALNEEDDFGYNDDDDFPSHNRRDGRGRHWNGGAFSRESLGRVSTLSTEEGMEMPVDEGMDINLAAGLDAPFDQDAQQASMHESAVSFYNPAVNVEVWFVALGAELANNGGMRAFLEEHAQDLRGAIIVDLEGLGAGELTLMEKEGKYLSKKPSSRMDRIVRKAASAVGISVAKGTQCWKDSASAFAMKHGHQAMHLVGELDGKSAFFAERDDVAENVDEETLYVNSDFVMEVLRKI